MNTKHVLIAFSLLFLSFLPVMGMNNQNTPQDLGIPLSEQETLSKKLSNDYQSLNDIDRRILLEQHLKNVKDIEFYTFQKRTAALCSILRNSIDKQQKIMGLIECASFINSPALEDIIKFGLANNLIPKEVLERSPNDTIKSIYQIKKTCDAQPENILRLMKEVLPEKTIKNINKLEERIYGNNFNPGINDIKTILNEDHEKKIHKIYDLRTTKIINTRPPFWESEILERFSSNPEQPKQNDTTKNTIKEFFNSTSLTNKIAFILRLSDLKKMALQDINLAESWRKKFSLPNPMPLIISTIFALPISLLTYIIMTKPEVTKKLTIALKNAGDNKALRTKIIEKFDNLFVIEHVKLICFNKNMKLSGLIGLVLGAGLFYAGGCSLTEAFQLSFLTFGSMFGLAPFSQIYSLLQDEFKQRPYTHKINQIKQEQKKIKNLIEEFKESIKKEYSF